MHKDRESKRRVLLPTGWPSIRMMPTVHRLNEQCFSLLAEGARTDRAATICNGVYGHSELWTRVDARACAFAGKFPVLLLDLKFQRSDWWGRVVHRERYLDSLNGVHELFAADRLAPLLREILVEAWGMARSKPHAANLLFGMMPSVCELVSGLSAADIDRIVVQHARALRPRF